MKNANNPCNTPRNMAKINMMLHNLLLLIICFVTLAINQAHCSEAIWEAKRQISPESLGISQYEIHGTPSESEVFVVRRTQETNDKVDSIYESVIYTGGSSTTQIVLLANPVGFPFTTTEDREQGVQLLSPDSGWDGDGWIFIRSRFGDNVLKFDFRKANGDNVAITFEGTIQEYSGALKRIPELPAIRDEQNAPEEALKEWTFGAIIKPYSLEDK